MLSTLWQKKDIETFSVCPENPTGGKGMGAMAKATPDCPSSELGDGWKVRPCVQIAPGEIYEMANVSGPAAIKHIWLTCLIDHGTTLPWFDKRHFWRYMILRMYWDNEETPSVEVPLSDFFACGWGEYAQVSSLAVCVNPGIGFNCYWEMPFKKNCRITVENRWKENATLYYQIDCERKALPDDILYFHAFFTRSNPTEYKKPHVILPKIEGKGCYVGTYMCWGVNNGGWWGEGEIKFYIDGDKDYPTVCGTGTEDYFCGAYNFENGKTGQYQEFTTPYTGLPQVLRPDGVYQSQTRFSLYRWHITDPIYFDKDLKVDIQALGWTTDFKFKSLRDDIASTCFWYQTLGKRTLPEIQSKEELEVV